MIISGGRSRKACSKLPISTTGHSTSPAVSREKRFVLDEFEPSREGKIARLGEDRAGRVRIASSMTLARASFGIILEAAHGEVLEAP